MNLLKSIGKLGGIIICLFLFVACQKSPSASTVALSYYDLIIHQNTSSIVSLGMPNGTAETITSAIHDNLHHQIEENLSMNNLLTPDTDQINEIEASYLTALSKLNATATETPKDNSVWVTLSTPYIDTKAIDSTATHSALHEVDISQFTDQSLYLQALTNAYVPNLIKGYEEAKPSEKHHEAAFEFTYQNGMWLPADYEAFVSSLCNLVVSDSN